MVSCSASPWPLPPQRARHDPGRGVRWRGQGPRAGWRPAGDPGDQEESDHEAFYGCDQSRRRDRSDPIDTVAEVPEVQPKASVVTFPFPVRTVAVGNRTAENVGPTCSGPSRRSPGQLRVAGRATVTGAVGATGSNRSPRCGVQAPVRREARPCVVLGMPPDVTDTLIPKPETKTQYENRVTVSLSVETWLGGTQVDFQIT